MAQLVVRNLEQSVKTKLQRRAKRHVVNPWKDCRRRYASPRWSIWYRPFSMTWS